MSDGHSTEHKGNEGHSETKDWTQTQQNQITSLYQELKGDYKAAADKALFGGQQLPYEQAHAILREALQKQEHSGGLDRKVQDHKESHKASGLGDLAALAGSIALVGGAVLGAPVVAGLGLLGTAYGFMKKYYSSKPAH